MTVEVEIINVEFITEDSLPTMNIQLKKQINKFELIRHLRSGKFKYELVEKPNVENHEQDVFDYFKKMFETKGFVEFVKPTSRFQINEEKKCVFLQLGSKKINIKCDKEDKFDWKIGLGLAISQLNDNAIYKAHREFFRNNKTHKLDIKKYANWILSEFYHNDMIDLHNLELRVENAKDKEFIDL